MKAVIVFESLFGNTERLARAVGAGLATDGAQVTLAEVRHVRPEDVRGCDLLVVGAPTHALSLSRPDTRADAVRQGAPPDRGESGVREWLSTLHETWGAGPRPLVAAFDTRLVKVRHWPGSAARKTARSLGHEGFDLLEPPTSFYVEAIKGPLATGERDRAQRWGRRLGVDLHRRRGGAAVAS